MWSYQLLPRPQDVIKWFFVPASFGVGLLLAGAGSQVSVLQFLLALLAFEYLVYEARYQWNDIRGLEDDLRHPGHAERGRLPVTLLGVRRSVALTLLVIVIRLALAGLIAWLVGAVTGALVVASGAALGVAVVYEVLRALKNRSVGRAIGIWLIVGTGYAIRTAFGLTLAGIRPDGSTALPFAALVAAAWSFGVMFVTLTWVMEATGLCFGGGQVPLFFPQDLVAKPQLFQLLRFTGVELLPVDAAPPLPEALEERPIAGRAPIFSPWNAGLVLATSFGVAACLPFGWAGAAVTVMAGVGAVVAFVVRSTGARCVAVGAILPVLVALAGLFVGWSAALAVGLVVSVFSAFYISFRNSSPADFRDFSKRVKSGLHAASTWVITFLRVLVRGFVGKRTWALLAGPLQP